VVTSKISIRKWEDMKRTKSVMASAALIGGFVLSAGLASGPASAVEMPRTLPQSATYEEALDVLKQEAGQQSLDEIAATNALASDSVHVELYSDEFGNILSAVAVQKDTRTRGGVWWESPGCSVKGACITANGRNLGYNGIGDLNGSWSGVTRIAAGEATTGLWAGGTGHITVKNKATSYSSPISGNRILRSR
jgi:hypothetical protein